MRCRHVVLLQPRRTFDPQSPQSSQFNQFAQWLGGAISVALSIVLMQLLSCTHPPAGGTALAGVETKAFDTLFYGYALTHALATPIVVTY
jgi:CBS-domain-containing membrane protein